MCDDDFDSLDLWIEEWRRSRKRRTCYACQETIFPGHDYHRSFGCYDGDHSTFEHCARCWRIVEALQENLPGRAVVELDLNCGERWEDTIGHLPRDVAELAFALPGELRRVEVAS